MIKFKDILNKKKKVHKTSIKEDMSPNELNKIRKIIRSEVAMILKDLWVKRNAWGG
tara:strand:+ start:3660 stop:3827 length:168 start_codon:yes stop_codon:yes gene_type:complete